jgi:DNA mismatch repair protein MutS
LDEIGRGTSTYDGISIAWSVAEYLLTAEDKTAKTLFATHYWELTKLEGKIPGAVNYNVAVSEFEDHIIFLRKIVKGGTDKSYGIHVARLAGMPGWVVSRAKEILAHLEENANRKSAFEPEKPKKLPPAKKRSPNDFQLNLF